MLTKYNHEQVSKLLLFLQVLCVVCSWVEDKGVSVPPPLSVRFSVTKQYCLTRLCNSQHTQLGMNHAGLASHCTLVVGWLEEKLGTLCVRYEGTKQNNNFARKVVVVTPGKCVKKVSSFFAVHRTQQNCNNNLRFASSSGTFSS